jgi:hypothetical protein
MKMRTITRKGLTVLAGILSCLLMLMGMFAATGIDFRLSTSLSVLYCALPILSFPIYLLALTFRRLAPIQAVLAIVFVFVYAALNERPCSELEYCGNHLAVVLMTLETPRVLAYFGVAICSLAAFVLDHRPVSRTSSKI